MKFKTEKELCEKFIEAHPRKEHLYKEVHVWGGRADIVHCEHKIVTIYEAKLVLNLPLLEQCISRKECAHFVYAVVPKVGRHSEFLARLFEEKGIGIIEINHQHYYPYGANNYFYIHLLEESKVPVFNRNPRPITLYEESKLEIAGSQNGGITPFGIMVDSVKKHLHARGKVSVDTVFKHQRYYGTLKQFKNNIYQWIRVGVIKGIEMENGMLWISENVTTKTK